MEKKLRRESVCVQAGWTPKKGEPRVLPIYQSTTFKYDNSEQMARLFDLEDTGYFYTRLQNPTNDAVAAKIAELEGGVGAMLTSSGQAANFYAVFNICQAGDHFVTSNTIYGGTYNLFGVTMKKHRMHVCRSGMGRQTYRSRFPSEHEMFFRRNHFESGRPRVRHRTLRPDGPQTRCALDCGQHFCHTNQLPPV